VLKSAPITHAKSFDSPTDIGSKSIFNYSNNLSSMKKFVDLHPVAFIVDHVTSSIEMSVESDEMLLYQDDKSLSKNLLWQFDLSDQVWDGHPPVFKEDIDDSLFLFLRIRSHSSFPLNGLTLKQIYR